ncbi:MAG: methylmalonyl-CoA mutase, partial [Candidatus Abyssubacteria bacterium]|nr:methylmalonyl-CoA mutase [Candidatus Abyssubacteria bacterium]
MYSKDFVKNLEAEYSRWEKTTLQKILNKYGLTPDSMPKQVYTPLDMRDEDFRDSIGFPGEFPFTRGIYPTMMPGAGIGGRAYSGFGTPEDTRDRLRFLLSHGQFGFSLAFDLPTQIGLDSDHPLAAGEVGKVGVALSSLRDMETILEAFDGAAPLERIRSSFTTNAQASVILAMYVTMAERLEIPLNKLTGTIQNDILKEYIARGTYIFPPEPSMRLAGDIFEYCSAHMPRFNMISICGYHIREAGATAVQELAFMLADAIAYAEVAVARGLAPDDFLPRFSFLFASHSNFFEEVAKFRAARRMWAKIARDRLGAEKNESMRFRVASGYAGSTFVAQKPLNNIARGTLQCFASIIGGNMGSASAPYDEALGLPTEEATIVALDTPRIIHFEAGAAQAIDPLGGSYYVEHLTDKIEEEANNLIEKIDSMGGAVAAIQNGFMPAEVESSSYKMQQEIENGTRRIVGVNEFVGEI